MTTRSEDAKQEATTTMTMMIMKSGMLRLTRQMSLHQSLKCQYPCQAPGRIWNRPRAPWRPGSFGPRIHKRLKNLQIRRQLEHLPRTPGPGRHLLQPANRTPLPLPHPTLLPRYLRSEFHGPHGSKPHGRRQTLHLPRKRKLNRGGNGLLKKLVVKRPQGKSQTLRRNRKRKLNHPGSNGLPKTTVGRAQGRSQTLRRRSEGATCVLLEVDPGKITGRQGTCPDATPSDSASSTCKERVLRAACGNRVPVRRRHHQMPGRSLQSREAKLCNGRCSNKGPAGWRVTEIAHPS